MACSGVKVAVAWLFPTGSGIKESLAPWNRVPSAFFHSKDELMGGTGGEGRVELDPFDRQFYILSSRTYFNNTHSWVCLHYKAKTTRFGPKGDLCSRLSLWIGCCCGWRECRCGVTIRLTFKPKCEIGIGYRISVFICCGEGECAFCPNACETLRYTFYRNLIKCRCYSV